MRRNVKGALFADYVRMVRSRKGVDWTRYLLPEDHQYLGVRIEPGRWYPMDTFERLGNAILHETASRNVELVRLWGRASVDQMRASSPELVAEGDPVETLMRFRVLRSTFFDFEALEIPLLLPDQAEIVIHYYMGDMAEEAASHQTMGFFDRLLELAGAVDIDARFAERSWDGDGRTLLAISWRLGSVPA